MKRISVSLVILVSFCLILLACERSTSSSVTFTATVKDSTGANLQNGYVSLYIHDSLYTTNVNNGSFTLLVDGLNNPGDTGHLIVYDLNGNTQSNAISVVMNGQMAYDLGQIVAHGVSSYQYMQMYLDGTIYNMTPQLDIMSAAIMNGKSTITDSARSGTNPFRSIKLVTDNNGLTGSFNLNAAYAESYIRTNKLYQFKIGTLIHIERSGVKGDYIQGWTSGYATEVSTSNDVIATISFRVMRK